MRSGLLDREISIEAYSPGTPDAAGTSTPAWSCFAEMRAQLIEADTAEYQRAYGDGANTAVVFRTRWLDGVTTAHRVTYQGRHLNIRDIKEIGRRNGLELRCEEVRE